MGERSERVVIVKEGGKGKLEKTKERRKEKKNIKVSVWGGGRVAIK